MQISKRFIYYLAIVAFYFLTGCDLQNRDDYSGIVESDLPVLLIDTYGKEIKYEPRALVQLVVIHPQNENEEKKKIEKFNIGIEYRGLYSGTIPKKQYGFEVQFDNQETKVPLLGLPAESDWVLYGPYSDKSLLRNYLAYTLWEMMGHYSPRGRFAELYMKEYIDGRDTIKYQGIYLLLEKIKRSKNRLYIQPAPTKVANDEELTFLIELIPEDRRWMSSEYFETEFSKSWFSIIYPGKKKLNSEYQGYVKNYVSRFEYLLYNGSDTSGKKYKDYIDILSVADYILFSEFVKNPDSFLSSLFIYKDMNRKMKLGPVWDYNIAFGNADYSFGRYTDGWFLQNLDKVWIDAFAKDTSITNIFKDRWKYFRKDVFNTQVIDSIIDRKVNYLADARIRNFEQWQILGERLWPNPGPVPETYEGEIDQLKQWIKERIEWMDANIESF